MENEVERFDPEKFATEVDADIEAEGAEETGDGTEEETQEEGTETEAEGEAGEDKAEAGADDEDAFSEGQVGKAIPYSAFKKKLDKWKGRLTEAEAKALKAQTEFEAYRKGQPGPELVEQLKAYQKVFGNLDQAVVSNPFLKNALLALGRGEQPDWNDLHQALSKHVEALPKSDPTVLRKTQELEERLQNFEAQQFTSSVRERIQEENEEIRKIVGDDEAAFDILNEIAEKLVPARGDLKDLPDRVALAKRLFGFADGYHKAKLTKMVPPANRTKPDLRTGKGLGQGSSKKEESEAPAYGTDEWFEWMGRTGQA